jgi:hypothetical protein
MLLSPGRVGPRLLPALALACLSACDAARDVEPPTPAAVEASQATAVPTMVIAARVTATLRHADSAAVRYGAPGAALDSITPAVAIGTDSATVVLPVLGLRPQTAYDLQVVAWAHDQPSTGELLRVTTGALPFDLPSFTAGGSAPLPGLVAFALGSYGLVIDNTGRVVWYRALPGGATLNFQPQPNGHFFTSPTNAPPGDLAPWVELDEVGEVVRTFGCAEGLRSRFHDILVEPDGGYWILCDETRTMDLLAVGGDAVTAVTASVVEHVGADGGVRFRWNAFDHFALTDLDPAFRVGPTVNFTHANAFDFDGAGRLLVSFRSLSEVTAIDLASGEVAWRMGGAANQFTFDEAGRPFARQHGLRVDADGRLVLLDNLGQPDGSRVERFALGSGREATRTGSLAGSPPVTALLGGAVQLLPEGHVLASYGNGDRVQEYDAAGNVAWEIHGDPGYVYRATRIASLYRPGAGLTR